MTIFAQTRALVRAALSVELRSRVAIVAIGGVIGVGIGGAYLGGEAVQASTLRAKAERLQEAGANGYTNEAMAVAAGGLDASALAIANRHDPYGDNGSARRDRQAEQLTARLEATSIPDAARPFRLANALDQSRDLDCLTRAAYYEARGEGAEGMKAVSQVVLNRVRHPAFPSTICGVVYQGSNRSTGCQFSFTCNGAMRGAVNPTAWNRARDIASQALSGRVYANVGNATHFHTTSVAPRWRNSLVQVTQVGDHLFYRFGGRAGSRDAFVSQPAPSGASEARLLNASLNSETPVGAPNAASSGPVAYKSLVAKEAPSAPVTAPIAPTVEVTPVNLAPSITAHSAPTAS